MADAQNQDAQNQDAENQAPQRSEPVQNKPDQTTPAPETTPAEKINRKFVIIGVIGLIVLIAGFFYWRSTFTEDTDDAQVDGDLYQVSSRVTGQVVKVYVEDNQIVKAGDLIAEIDPRDSQVALEQAQAALASAQASAIQAQVNVPITSTTVSTNVSNSTSDVEGTAASAIWTVDWQQFAEEEQTLVSESLAGWQERYPDVVVRRHSVRGLPVEALVRQSENACLVVLGTRGRGGFKGLLLGSVSQGVIHRSHCPVAIVHAAKEPPDDRDDTSGTAPHGFPVPPVRELT